MSKRSGSRIRQKAGRKPYLLIGIAAVVVVLALLAAALWSRLGGAESGPQDGESVSDGQTEQTDGQEETLPPADLELEDRMEAPYEHWLSAAVLTGISIQYPAFEPGAFYTAGETALEDAMDSAGVYLTFTLEGEEMCIHAAPLEGERGDAGTKDVYSEVIGFATFEEVDPAEIPAEFSAVEIAEINELITQSTRVMVYEH